MILKICNSINNYDMFFMMSRELQSLCYYRNPQYSEFYVSSFNGLYLLIKYPEYLRQKSKTSLKSKFNKYNAKVNCHGNG